MCVFSIRWSLKKIMLWNNHLISNICFQSSKKLEFFSTSFLSYCSICVHWEVVKWNWFANTSIKYFCRYVLGLLLFTSIGGERVNYRIAWHNFSFKIYLFPCIISIYVWNLTLLHCILNSRIDDVRKSSISTETGMENVYIFTISYGEVIVILLG